MMKLLTPRHCAANASIGHVQTPIPSFHASTSLVGRDSSTILVWCEAAAETARGFNDSPKGY